MTARVQPAIIGATGYSGFEVTRLMLHHPHAKKPVLLSRESGVAAGDLADAYPHLSGNGFGSLAIQPLAWEKLKGVDVVFLCTPHEFSREWVPDALGRGIRVIDLSGAWRLKNDANRAVYGFHDAHPETATVIDHDSVYGVPELHARELPGAQVVANAGCYATSIILALAPWLRAGFVDVEHDIICDAKSGVSGAGKAPTAKTHFVEVADNLSAYSVFGHRHTGEILEQLGLDAAQLQFTPHLLPIPRGILSTIYVRVHEGVDASKLESSLRVFYAGKPFVRVFGGSKLPQIKFSLYSNYCDIGFAFDEKMRRAVIVSCLDNLLKGAAGQAVQNMNVMFGFDEREGLQ
jgi:N-acetyl-gamma-glutamyl-phosphate reductase